MTAPCFSQIGLKFGLHRSLLPPEILPQSDHLFDFSVEDIPRQIAAEWLFTAQ